MPFLQKTRDFINFHCGPTFLHVLQLKEHMKPLGKKFMSSLDPPNSTLYSWKISPFLGRPKKLTATFLLWVLAAAVGI